MKRSLFIVVSFSLVCTACKQPSTQDSKKQPGRIISFDGSNSSWRSPIGNAAPLALSFSKGLAPDTPKYDAMTAAKAAPDDIPSDRLLLGQGFNSLSAEKGALCVDYDPNNDAAEVTTTVGSPDTAGQHTEYRLEQISSLETLKKAENIDASASFGFGIFSADASASFISSGEFTQYNNFVFVQVKVLNAFQQLKRRVLRPPALAWARQGANTFVDHCGDEYVYGRQMGVTSLPSSNSRPTASRISKRQPDQSMSQLAHSVVRAGISIRHCKS